MSEDENRALFFEAIAHQQAGRLRDAEAAYRTVLARNPRVVAAHNNLALLLEQRGLVDEAAACLRAALELRPDHVEALNNLGILTRQNHDLDAALGYFRRALELRPDNLATLVNMADTLIEQGRTDEVPGLHMRALRIDPNDVRIKKGQARLLVEQGERDRAIALLAEAAQHEPGDIDVLCELMTQRQAACDWTDFSALESSIIEAMRIGSSKGRVSPFLAVSLFTSPQEQYLCAKRYADALGLNGSGKVTAPARRAGGKLRIGYISSDFCEHPTAYLTSDFLGKHDRRKFDVLGYSSGRPDSSPARRRIEAACDSFTDLHGLSDRDAAQRIADDNLDVLVDISGYSKRNRLHILSYRPAPIQVSFLSFPGTLAMQAVDYLIADATVIPPTDAPAYGEKIVSMPVSYQVNDSARPVAPDTPTRSDCGLPDGAFVFCCFNHSFKLRPQFFDIWSRLLAAVPGSVLWLIETNPSANANLRREAEKRGLDPARLVFAPRRPLPEHLARHSHADLILDTLPYGAHTTMSDALWMGVPAVTCIGESFAGRVGASLLRAVGLDELITDNVRDYEQLALSLAKDPARLHLLRDKLKNPSTLPLFDTARYARDIEKAYERMVELHRAGKPPEHIKV